MVGLDLQLEEEYIYIYKLQDIYTNYIVMDFWNWKIWTSLLFVPLYTCIFLYEFYLGYIIWTQYMIFLINVYMCKKFARKKKKKKGYGLLNGLNETYFHKSIS